MYLITGAPETGKSTAINRIVHMLGYRNCSGFLTSEIRENGQRVGFMTRTLSGEEIVLAHKNLQSEYMVEDFGVDVDAFETLMEDEIGSFMTDTGKQFLIIDEIGPMQLFSQRFRRVLEELMNSDRTVIATICQWNTDWLDSFRADSRNILFDLTVLNRPEMPVEIVSMINSDDEEYLSKVKLARHYSRQPERFSYEIDRIMMQSTHDIRTICYRDRQYFCSCGYFQHKGTCSHIMALVLKDSF